MPIHYKVSEIFEDSEDEDIEINEKDMEMMMDEEVQRLLKQQSGDIGMLLETSTDKFPSFEPATSQRIFTFCGSKISGSKQHFLGETGPSGNCGMGKGLSGIHFPSLEVKREPAPFKKQFTLNVTSISGSKQHSLGETGPSGSCGMGKRPSGIHFPSLEGKREPAPLKKQFTLNVTRISGSKQHFLGETGLSGSCGMGKGPSGIHFPSLEGKRERAPLKKQFTLNVTKISESEPQFMEQPGSSEDIEIFDNPQIILSPYLFMEGKNICIT